MWLRLVLPSFPQTTSIVLAKSSIRDSMIKNRILGFLRCLENDLISKVVFIVCCGLGLLLLGF